MSATRWLACLLATATAPPAFAQGLEGGVSSGPSEQLSVPPNRQKDPNFSYGARAVEADREAAGNADRGARAAHPAGRAAGRPAPAPPGR